MMNVLFICIMLYMYSKMFTHKWFQYKCKGAYGWYHMCHLVISYGVLCHMMFCFQDYLL